MYKNNYPAAWEADNAYLSGKRPLHFNDVEPNLPAPAANQPMQDRHQFKPANPPSARTQTASPMFDPSGELALLSDPDMMAQMAMPETLMSATYVPGFLRTQIGKPIRVEFYIGTQMTDRVGKLVEVGASYILLEEFSGNATIMCDLFSIKFVTIVNTDDQNMMFIP